MSQTFNSLVRHLGINPSDIPDLNFSFLSHTPKQFSYKKVSGVWYCMEEDFGFHCDVKDAVGRGKTRSEAKSNLMWKYNRWIEDGKA